jgi:hypothetical protein
MLSASMLDGVAAPFGLPLSDLSFSSCPISLQYPRLQDASTDAEITRSACLDLNNMIVTFGIPNCAWELYPMIVRCEGTPAAVLVQV